MDKLTSVNWSKVAQESFEIHSTIQELKDNQMSTEAGIERLRASKKTNAEREEAEGISVGKKWALETAKYDQLANVAGFSDALTPDTRALAEALGCDSPSWKEASQEMESIFGNDDPSEVLIRGFIDGAAEVFNMV